MMNSLGAISGYLRSASLPIRTKEEPSPKDLIKKLYTEHNLERIGEIRDVQGYRTTLKEVLQRIEEKPLVGFALDQLDKFNDDDLLTLLSYLPSNAIVDELGQDALIWAWVKCPEDNEIRKSFAKGIENHTDFNIKTLRKAYVASRRFCNIDNTSTVVKNHQLISELRKTIQGIYLQKILKSHAKPGVVLSDKRMSDYSLDTLHTQDISTSGWAKDWSEKSLNSKHFDIFLDSPIGISLMYKKEPNALVAVHCRDKETLFINQLQGVRPNKTNEKGESIDSWKLHSRGLMVLEWEKLLVTICEEVAKQFNLKSIAIQGQKNNHWIHDSKKALKRYDETAKQLGYVKQGDKNWYKHLSVKK